nr:hypothetical protein [Bradyrhizobium canariense]
MWSSYAAPTPDSRGGAGTRGRKVGATISWVSPGDASPAEVRLYGRLFAAASAGSGYVPIQSP